MSDQFKFSAIKYKLQNVRAIGYSGPPIKVGVENVEVDCLCGHSWIARDGGDLHAVLGAIIVKCPRCGFSAPVDGNEFNL